MSLEVSEANPNLLTNTPGISEVDVRSTIYQGLWPNRHHVVSPPFTVFGGPEQGLAGN